MSVWSTGGKMIFRKGAKQAGTHMVAETAEVAGKGLINREAFAHVRKAGVFLAENGEAVATVGQAGAGIAAAVAPENETVQTAAGIVNVGAMGAMGAGAVRSMRSPKVDVGAELGVMASPADPRVSKPKHKNQAKATGSEPPML